MTLTTLTRINIVISIVLALLVFAGIPVLVEFINAFKAMQNAKPVKPFSLISLLGLALIPVAIGAVLILAAKIVEKNHPNVSRVLLSIYPAMVCILMGYIAWELY